MLRIALSLIIICANVVAGNHIEVIYPKDGQQIPAVDSTFILGNTESGANLTINGTSVKIHKDGGFLAFLPVEVGEFRFDLVSDNLGDICPTSIELIIGSAADTSAVFIDLSSVSPSGKTALLPGEIFEFSFKASAEGRAWCSLAGDSIWTRMYPAGQSGDLASVFGDIPDSDSPNARILYWGELSVNSIRDSSRVYFLFEIDRFDSVGAVQWTEFTIDSTGYYIVKLAETLWRTIMLTGRPRIIRIAPGKGYRLVNQPAGVRFLCTGEMPDYYRVRLSRNSSGYVRKSDAVMEPIGTNPPRGEVSFITVNDFADSVRISAAFGDKLPFEINTEDDLMTVEIYGLNSDTDWIRFNGAQAFIKSLRWSQPQDDIYRLNIRIDDRHFWGYRGYYDGDEFVLRLNKRPPGRRFFHSAVNGLKIAIDPGHSHDSGAIGPTGLKEKDANLWIAHELRRLLISKGANVLMTRLGHEDLDLNSRVDKVSKWGADLLISIHNNALPDGVNPFTHNGTSVYYYFEQARPLAQAIHRRLLAATKLPDHGLYYGNLALTRVTDCPSVLVECAFMMIPEQEAKLKTDRFQRQCARAIYEGMCDYLEAK